MKCKYHLCNNEVEQTKKIKVFCSHRCKNLFHVNIRRRKLKILALEYKGGKCVICGYNKCASALTFHHRNPLDKSFGISNPETRSWEKLKKELDKCDLLCCRCHAEIEDAKLQTKHDTQIKHLA